MGRYIKYIREENIFEYSHEIEEYFDSIIERGFEIIYYDEKFFSDSLEFKPYYKIKVVLGKLNSY